jgi:hypothetical protein
MSALAARPLEFGFRLVPFRFSFSGISGTPFKIKKKGAREYYSR